MHSWSTTNNPISEVFPSLHFSNATNSNSTNLKSEIQNGSYSRRDERTKSPNKSNHYPTPKRQEMMGVKSIIKYE